MDPGDPPEDAAAAAAASPSPSPVLDDPATAPDPHSPSTAAVEDEEDDDRVYLVPYRWLTEARESTSDGGGGGDGKVGVLTASRGILYTASPAQSSYVSLKIINSLFNSDLVFNLRREDDLGHGAEESVSSRSYALVRTDIWSRALRWHRNSSSAKTSINSSFAEDDSVDVYAVTLRVSILSESGTMTVKLTKKDNTIEYFKRASKIFSMDSTMVRIWDFSGQLTLIFMNEINKLHRDGQRQADQEIILELHVFALSESLACPNDGRKDDIGMQITRKISCCGGPLMSNGSMGTTQSEFVFSKTNGLNGSSKMAGSLGLIGLENLGNTCFMNSAIQCLAHTPKLFEYFLGDYCKEINHNNPLGMSGELALAFGELLRKLWAPEKAPVAPKVFKSKLARFAPQFSGFNQHDSQELLAFLLDGLHEDLNRVKHKPYVEVNDALDRPHEEVADEYWQNHLARNDSIIVDICQGQYRSTLVCPDCSKVSVTFDPFMYLSLPLPSTTLRTMTLTVISTDGSVKPSPYTITVPKYGKCKDLTQSLSIACSLREDESLLIAEVYSNQIIRYLEEPSDSLSLIRDGDRLAAYRLPKGLESSPLVVFMHQQMDEQDIHGKMIPPSKLFSIPLLARFPDTSDTCRGSTILDLFLKLLNPFLRSDADSTDGKYDDGNISSVKVANTDTDSSVPESEGTIGIADDRAHNHEMQLYITDARGQRMDSKMTMQEEISMPETQMHLHILASWPKNVMELYDMSLLNTLPEVYKSGFLARSPQDSVSLYACLDSFLKEEPLGPEDMWYCPSCKMHRQASKKLDLWRLPEVLVIHLKRFSYSRFMKNKLETIVDFPIRDFDLSAYIASKNHQQSHHYELFAVSNHYGSMGGGHYTAYVHHTGDSRWYDFDDRLVTCIPEDNVKTSAAYVLFYKRVQSIDMDT